MAEDGGVLGNLPRSRPGQRSEKRTGKTSAEAATRAERSDAKAAKPAAGAEPKRAAGAEPKRAAGAEPKRSAGAEPKRAAEAKRAARPAHASASRGGDPVGGAIRTVAGVAGIGVKLAGGVAREVLRRIPRP